MLSRASGCTHRFDNFLFCVFKNLIELGVPIKFFPFTFFGLQEFSEGVQCGLQHLCKADLIAQGEEALHVADVAGGREDPDGHKVFLHWLDFGLCDPVACEVHLSSPHAELLLVEDNAVVPHQLQILDDLFFESVAVSAYRNVSISAELCDEGEVLPGLFPQWDAVVSIPIPCLSH